MTNEASPEAYATEPASTAPPSQSADESVARPPRWKRRITIASVLIVILAAAVVLPPFINISRYQRQVTGVVSRALGRPVRLSSVELRLLPRPGFVLRDLSVSENPAFGAEPILSAQTVVASIRILSLWRGHVEVNRISVDEASLNLVRSAQGMWNLQSIMTGRLGISGSGSNSGNPSAGSPHVLPYLEATNSRVNLKNGLEKSPFSLANTQLSLWQDSPGAWRLRLRGQPVRTDMEISMADTGEVRVEASLQTSNPSRELRDMPLKLQAEWRDAQLGQLSRLLFGSDAGWRGDLTADMDVQGTPDAAQTKTRLRATGVRREEFAPETPLDFDANCSFLYKHSQQAVHNLGCDTAIGSGQLHLNAELPGSGSPEAMLEVRQLPLQAGLDLLRTVRSGFAPGMSAQGSVSGSLNLTPAAVNTPHSAPPRSSSHTHKKQPAQAAVGSLGLQGSLVVAGGVLKGGSLKQPITLPKMNLTPVQVPVQSPGQATGNAAEIGLNSRFTVSLGQEPVAAPASTPVSTSAPTTPQAPAATDTVPQSAPRAHPPASTARPQELVVRLLLTAAGYNATVGGTASIAKLRELAYDFGVPHQEAADRFSAGTADIDLAATGPWIPSSNGANAAAVLATPAPALPPRASSTPESLPATSDRLAGSLQLHHAEWQAPYLARPVELPQGNIALTGSSVTLTSDFTYGALKGSLMGSLSGALTANTSLNASAGTAPTPCDTANCPPQLQIRLGGAVDAKDIQEALLGSPEKKTLLSPLIDKMRSSDHPKWPPVTVRVQSDSLVLGPATLSKPTLLLKLTDSEIVLQSWQAGLLGGSANGTGRCIWDANGLKYTIEGQFSKISPTLLGTLLNSTAANSSPAPDADNDSEPATAGAWLGGPLNGTGSLQISGLNSKGLAASAAGTVRFNWSHGSVPIASSAHDDAAVPTSVETRFDAWDGAATLGGGKAQLAANTMRQGKHTSSVTGTIPFGGLPHLSLGAAGPKSAPASSEPSASPAPSSPKVQ